MKKAIIFIALLAMCRNAYAQAGSLTLNNNNLYNCGVYVTMFAVAPSEGDGTACDIRGYVYYLPPGSVSFSSPATFTPGFSYEATFISPTVLATIKDWNWSDVEFQWNCPIPPCVTDAGGNMVEPGPFYTHGFCSGGSSPTWSGDTSCLAGTSIWTSTLSGNVMANVTIDFN